MRSRPGVWLRSLMAGLLTRPVLGYVRVPVDKDHTRLEPLWPNRTQARFLSARTAHR